MNRCESWQKCRVPTNQCYHKAKHEDDGCTIRCKAPDGIRGSTCRPVPQKPAVNWEKRARELHRAIRWHVHQFEHVGTQLNTLAAQRPDGRVK
jgi:hypothetical protein